MLIVRDDESGDVVADTGCFRFTTPKLKEAEFLIAYSSIDGHESYGNE